MGKSENILENSNALLGFLIKHMDKNHDCEVKTIFAEIGEDKSMDLQILVNELLGKGFITHPSFEIIHVNPGYKKNYMSMRLKAFLTLKEFIKFCIYSAIGAIITIFVQNFSGILEFLLKE